MLVCTEAYGLFLLFLYITYLAASGLCVALGPLLFMHSFTLWRKDSLVEARGLRSPGASVVVAHGLSCSVACGIVVLQPGIQPESPTFQDGFSTTGSPGKSPFFMSRLFEIYFTYLYSLST